MSRGPRPPVVAVDVDESVTERIDHGEAPIHEPGLAELLDKCAGNRLRATTDYGAIRGTDATVLCLPTPSDEDGRIDTRTLEAGVASVGESLGASGDRHLVVFKSTVVPGTTERVLEPLLEARVGAAGEAFDLVVNPEFLREGSSVADFFYPAKVVFESATDLGHDALAALYEPLFESAGDVPVVRTGHREAEMIKYANNAFLAAKLSLVNELGKLCKEYGVDAYEVAGAIGLDGRIGARFFRSGVGWGGSCFPKDVAALVAALRDAGYEPELLDASVAVNQRQPRRLLDLLNERVGGLDADGDEKPPRIAVLRLAFKPGTDDVHHSRAVPVVESLLDRGVDVVAYDPVTAENARELFPGIEYADSAAAALRGVDGAVVLTDWDEFDAMQTPVVVDGRRIV